MGKILALKIVSIGLTLGGAIVTLALTACENQRMENDITEKVYKEVMNQMNKQGTE